MLLWKHAKCFENTNEVLSQIAKLILIQFYLSKKEKAMTIMYSALQL